MATPSEWKIGYARQADADFTTMEILEGISSIPHCHRLQFLQMACEKLVKAHLCGTGTDPRSLQSSHAYIAKNLSLVLRELPEFKELNSIRAASILHYAKLLALEIEVLAPAVRRGGNRPDNCEYPWEDNGAILHIPLDWSFNTRGLMLSPNGRTVKKLIRLAIKRMVP